jgi:aspartyl-tRNA(Asn)/glutamyl-tRNA(Gln) amidotransferase subunit B
MMTQSLAFARYYEAARDACKQPKLVANWLMGEVSKRLNAASIGIEEAPVPPEILAGLISNVANGTIGNAQARALFEDMWRGPTKYSLRAQTGHYKMTGSDVVLSAIREAGLEQMTDSGALEAIVDQVLAANPKSVDEYRAGKDKALNALVGQVMKASQGKANPAQINELLRRKVSR